jgi:cold shock CspA family protein
MFQVKWFDKKKGYGFATDGTSDYFCHHSDIKVTGFRYLKRGEYVAGTPVPMEGKEKLSEIRAPMEGGKLMCEVDSADARPPASS